MTMYTYIRMLFRKAVRVMSTLQIPTPSPEELTLVIILDWNFSLLISKKVIDHILGRKKLTICHHHNEVYLELNLSRVLQLVERD